MKRILTFLLVITLIPATAHKFYVSIAEMEYEEGQDRIKVSLKLTAHDFEHVLEDKFDEHIHIEKYNDTSKVIQYAIEYLSSNIQLFSNDKRAEFQYLGKEVTLRDELYFYFTFNKISNPATVKIVNSLLFSFSDQQQNIVHYKYKDQTKSVTLIPSQPEALISFD